MRTMILAVLGVVICLASLAGGNLRAEPGCKTVSGNILEVQIPATDPLGRVLGPVTGTLNGSASAILTSLGPGAEPGTLEATSQDVFVTKDGDMLVTEGHAVFTILDSTTVGDVLTLEVDGGASTGIFAGATGTIIATGTGYNLGAGPGQTHFELSYQGQVCQQ